MSTQVIPAAVTSPSEGEKPTSEEPPQPRPSSKAILRKALALANDAVLSDTANNVDGAVEAYSEAVRLLDIVLGSMENESDKAKLRDIHATYSERIRLLSKLSKQSVPATPPRATTPPPPAQLPLPSEPEVQPVPTSSTDENTVRIANVQAPPTHIVMMPSTSTPTPGKPSTRRKTNRRSASFSEMTNQRVSVFNIPPPPPFQPPQQLKETSTKNRSQLSLEIPKVTSLPPKKKSPSLPVPPPPADPPFSAVKAVDLTQNTESLSVVTDELDDPVKTLASVLSESPTDVDLSNPPPPPFHSTVNNRSAQHLKPPPRTHSIIGHTIPRARKSSLLATSVYRSASPSQEDHETNANQAFARLTGQRAPAEVLRVGSAEGSGERFDRNATIKALSLMRSLELSMTVGCHITQRLYVPKNLWYQPNIRLPSVDVKVSICETLLMALTRLEAWQRLDDIRGTLAQLAAIENTLENAKVSLTRKLGMPRSRSEHSLPNEEPEIYRKETQARKHQSIIAWGSKFTKSVERMNAFNLTKSTDDPHQYVDTLVRLFRSVHVLGKHYHHLTFCTYTGF
ncbi:hypothetical protein K450DRAFT_233435 [Umbelopsis ramanniana AG]|uniref:MIT domain-containing protein n=1 Tax=Umbelopsis ramanniana AG TaxID=1314678 RepID=A0AAD5ED80_UMBRA|nr:uncharacterized protein K450DRAFT_233435 [Umbelopsis ramanniana AG]KAI8581172.1 hypothetical protein K450DRAFT_233435 [Umbelopsis ramanniana AG]